MPCDIPHFKACCFCVPLMPGLALTACIYLVTQTIMILVTCTLMANIAGGGYILVPSLIVMGFNILFALVLLLATLKERLKLFRVYFYYGIVATIVQIVIMVISMGILIFMAPQYRSDAIPREQFWQAALNYGAREVLEIVSQIYVVLMVRSVIREHENRHLPK